VPTPSKASVAATNRPADVSLESVTGGAVCVVDHHQLELQTMGQRLSRRGLCRCSGRPIRTTLPPCRHRRRLLARHPQLRPRRRRRPKRPAPPSRKAQAVTLSRENPSTVKFRRMAIAVYISRLLAQKWRRSWPLGTIERPSRGRVHGRSHGCRRAPIHRQKHHQPAGYQHGWIGSLDTSQARLQI